MTLAILTRPTNITRSTEVPRNPHITSFSPFRLSVFSLFCRQMNLMTGVETQVKSD